MKIHFMGIGGAGTSAAASLAKNLGFEVSGCDTDPSSSYLKELKDLKINVENSHVPSHLKDVDLVVTSLAIEKADPQNIEISEAGKRVLSIISTEKFVVNYLAKDKFLIAISGTHGKSTTTAMIGQILEDSGEDPTVYVGAIVNRWGKNYRFGQGKYFVVEADEYKDKFLIYHPKIGIITNIEFDHPDFFKNEEEMVKSFVKFVNGFKKDSKLIVSDKSNPNSKKLIESVGDIELVEGALNSDPEISLQIPGIHNVSNAKLAYLCGKILGVKEDVMFKTLSKFTGISRRFEFKVEIGGIKLFDDYAHHPTEISASLLAVREKFPNERVWCIYQPHMYSRTKGLFSEFVKSFENAPVDKLVLVDIFAAREKNEVNVSSLDLVKSIKSKDAKYIGDLEEAAIYVAKNAAFGDVVISMGAGDIVKLTKLIENKLKGQNGRK